MDISTYISGYTGDNILSCFITYDESNEEDKVVWGYIKISISSQHIKIYYLDCKKSIYPNLNYYRII